MFEFSSTIRYSEVDYRGKLNLLGILNYFQDCSTMQSEEIGAGIDVLHNRNLVWVLSTWNIEVKRFPQMGEQIIIGTFPYAFRNYFGMRNYYMKTTDGEMLAMADSMWTLLNYKESTIASVPDEIRNIYPVEEKLPMEYMKGRIKIPDDLEAYPAIPVKYHHLDANMHVNNGRYVEIALDDLPVKDYTRLRVEYRKMALDKDILTPYIGSSEDSKVVLLQNSEGEHCTVLSFS